MMISKERLFGWKDVGRMANKSEGNEGMGGWRVEVCSVLCVAFLVAHSFWFLPFYLSCLFLTFHDSPFPLEKKMPILKTILLLISLIGIIKSGLTCVEKLKQISDTCGDNIKSHLGIV
jgi:hypothetical protein